MSELWPVGLLFQNSQQSAKKLIQCYMIPTQQQLYIFKSTKDRMKHFGDCNMYTLLDWFPGHDSTFLTFNNGSVHQKMFSFPLLPFSDGYKKKSYQQKQGLATKK